MCHVHNPELKSIDQQGGKLSDQRKWKQVYVPKSKPSTDDAGPSNTVLQNTSDPPPQENNSTPSFDLSLQNLTHKITTQSAVVSDPPQQQASLNLPKEPLQQVPLIPQEHTPALESRQTHAQKRVESATAVTPSDDDSDAHSDGDFPKFSQEIGFPSQVLEEVHVAPIEGDTTEVPAAVDMLIEGESFTMALVPYSNLPLASDDSCLLQSKKGENRKFLSSSKSPRLMVFSKEEVFSDLRAFNTKLQLFFEIQKW